MAAGACACHELTGCVTTAPYDQYVYAQTTGLKVDALKLMAKAGREYSTQKEAVEKFTDAWDKIYEYELHRRNNGIRINMWNLLRDPQRHLLGGFLARWQKESTLSETFISEAKIQVGKAFDQLSELESGKIKPKELQ
ncbi:MAG: hypothetical protein QM664_14235 [Flavihumibacter sp.]